MEMCEECAQLHDECVDDEERLRFDEPLSSSALPTMMLGARRRLAVQVSGRRLLHWRSTHNPLARELIVPEGQRGRILTHVRAVHPDTRGLVGEVALLPRG